MLPKYRFTRVTRNAPAANDPDIRRMCDIWTTQVLGYLRKQSRLDKPDREHLAALVWMQRNGLVAPKTVAGYFASCIASLARAGAFTT